MRLSGSKYKGENEKREDNWGIYEIHQSKIGKKEAHWTQIPHFRMKVYFFQYFIARKKGDNIS